MRKHLEIYPIDMLIVLTKIFMGWLWKNNLTKKKIDFT